MAVLITLSNNNIETNHDRHKDLLVFRKLHPKKSISMELIYAKQFVEIIFTIFKGNPKIKPGQSFKLTDLLKLVLQHFSE